MVTLNFDTETPHPREFFRVQGTKGVFMSGASLPRAAGPAEAGAQSAARAAGQYGRRGGMMYIDGRSPVDDHWESAEPYYDEYQHPFLKAYQPKPRKKALRGHGGGASVTPVNWERLIAALRNNRMPDWDVYDSVTSSAISPLSEKSVAGGNTPVEFPDFTRGKWKTNRPYDIA
jgi:hypothetical protein